MNCALVSLEATKYPLPPLRWAMAAAAEAGADAGAGRWRSGGVAARACCKGASAALTEDAVGGWDRGGGAH